ncbi:hypothetical protein HYY75_09715, partial [bacterium]|nr:hypothetical protein [bacterium]
MARVWVKKFILSAKQRGSAIIGALIFGGILMIVIGAVMTFTSYRMEASIQEWWTLKAMGIAEAGMAVALAELAKNVNFATHEVTVGKDLPWGSAKTYQVSTKNIGTLSIKAKDKAFWCNFGEGEFKIKCGSVPYKNDNLKTPGIDETKTYKKLEILAKLEGTVRRISAVLQSHLLAREFFLYDGNILSTPEGWLGDKDFNYFCGGRYYGHNGVEIGKVRMEQHVPKPDGTRQIFQEVDFISSGNGNIYCYDDTRFFFKQSPGKEEIFKKNSDITQGNTTYNTSEIYGVPDTKANLGGLPYELIESHPKIPENFRAFVKDELTAIKIPPVRVPFGSLKNQAQSGGLALSSASGKKPAEGVELIDYPLPKMWDEGGSQHSIKAFRIDFGTQISPKNGPAKGIIYSEVDLIVHGNPSGNITIVSEKNIFISGDFNQKGVLKVESKPEGDLERFGLPQNYEPGPWKSLDSKIDYGRNNFDYFGLEGGSLKEGSPRKSLLDDVSKTESKKKHHFAVSLIAKKRIVFDYRNPLDCFENEIYPFMRYKLAEFISKSNDPDNADSDGKIKSAFLVKPFSGEISGCSAQDPAGLEQSLVKFFGRYSL